MWCLVNPNYARFTNILLYTLMRAHTRKHREIFFGKFCIFPKKNPFFSQCIESIEGLSFT